MKKYQPVALTAALVFTLLIAATLVLRGVVSNKLWNFP